MGNEQSSQNAPEQEDTQVAREKPWSPDDISESDNESHPDIERTSVASGTSPDPALSSSQSRRAKQTKSKSRSVSRSSLSRLSNNEVADTAADAANIDGEHTQDASTQEPTEARKKSRRKLKRNKFEQQVTGPASPSNMDVLQDSPAEDAQPEDQDDMIAEITTQASQSQAEAKTQKDRYRCPHANTYDCTKTFATERIAKRHAEIHFGGERFSCSMCDKSYTRIDKLKKHQQSHSQDEVQQENVMPKLQQLVTDEDVEESVHDNGSDQEDQHEHENVHQDLQEIAESIPRAVSAENVTTPEPADQSSTKESTSTTSVFDQPVLADTEVVEETPRPRLGLKRKRNLLSASQPLPRPTEPSRKRRGQHSLSPPTSISSGDEQETSNKRQKHDDAAVVPSSAPISGMPKSKALRTGNLDNFAKPWIPGSQLRHPIHNPRSPKVQSSQRVQIMVPSSSQAESSAGRTKARTMVQTQNSRESSSLQTPRAKKQRSAIYSSPKGKRKAENGVRYSSPPKDTSDVDDSDEILEPEGMATSVAKRGSSQSAQKRLKSNNATTSAGVPQSQSGSDPKPFGCLECNRRFATKAGLQRHEKRPNVHSTEHKCDDCSETFLTIEALRDHEQDASHGDGTGYAGRKGAFSAAEVRKLLRWRDMFCEDNAINIPTFNQMMTDSCRRVKGHIWPYRHITKADFLQEYFDVLPGRNRRSMNRYRERAFQNVPEHQEWTEEDDEELTRLVKEIGQKWVEIGQRMTRTQDSVSQRWRFKLQYRGSTNQGEWLASEEDKLVEAVEQVKKAAGLSLDPEADIRIPWESVSKKMRGTRTAQQCSNKWRLMHYTRKGNKFVKPSEIDRKLGTPGSTATPSKMSQRLAGQTPSSRGRGSSSKKYVSQEYVQESDDDNASSAEEQSEEELLDNNSKSDSGRGLSREQSLDRSESGTPPTRRNPLPTRTPQTGSGLSQAFAQTQANTSALRAPHSTRKHHTQTEMPTPGIPVQHRSDSSPWRTIRSGSPDSDTSRTDKRRPIRQDEAAIMAEPMSSDGEARIADEAEGLTDEEASSAETSSSSSEEEDAEDVIDEDARSSSSSQSSSSAESANKESTSSDQEFDNDEMVQSTQKDSFIQSLQPLSSKYSSNAKVDKSSSKIDWRTVLSGEEPPIQQDGQSDEEDLDDIMHH